MATNLPAVDDDERELLARLIRDARGGLSIPRIALRHRLQRDVHGLDRSRHRMVGEAGQLVIEDRRARRAGAAGARRGVGCIVVTRSPVVWLRSMCCGASSRAGGTA
jgi:hypothetical protein